MHSQSNLSKIGSLEAVPQFHSKAQNVMTVTDPSLIPLVLAQVILVLVQDAASSGEAVLHINELHFIPSILKSLAMLFEHNAHSVAL